MPNEAIVHVVDDDVAVRQSLSFLLASDGFPVRLYESASAFLNAVNSAASGCIVTDVRMPDIDGIELLRRLKARRSTLPVIVITGHADVPLAVEAMKEGAVDFIEKPFEERVLLEAITRAVETADKNADAVRRKADLMARVSQLTPRQRQVMDRVVQGQSSKEIAAELGISPRTVETYRLWIMEKMGASSTAMLIRMAMVLEQ